MMKVSTSILAAVLVGILTTAGQCKSITEGPYIGLGMGYSMADIDSKTIEEGFCGGACVSYKDDENSFGFKVFGGYLFNEYFAVEGGYVNLGEFTYKAVSTTNSTKGSYKPQGANLDLLFHFPLYDELFSLTARGGLLYSWLKEDYSNAGDFTKDELGFKYGLGFQYDLAPEWGLRGEWEDYHMKESLAGGADIHLFSIGLVYRFGIEEKAVPEPEPVVVIKEVEVAAEPVVITTPPPPAERIVFASDALFDFDEAKLVPQGKAMLAELVENINESDRLIITGHTDDVGEEDYNLELSYQRANSVRNFLIIKGISPLQMEIIAKGESEPIEDNSTDEGRAANRRVDISIITTKK